VHRQATVLDSIRQQLNVNGSANVAVCDHEAVGLDIYVGSLTRYLAGNWELVAQKAACEMGLELINRRPKE
jgi:hypothetical protein